MGFAASAPKEKTPTVPLLATVSSEAEAKAAANAGLDGALVVGITSKAAVDKISKALNSHAWGLWKTHADTTPPEKADFQVFSSEATPLAAIGGEAHATIMQVSPELDDSLLRTIEDIPVDAFLVSLAGVDSLTVHQLMRIARVRGVTSKWLFLHLASVPSINEVERLREAGVCALIVDGAGKSSAELKKARAALLALPNGSPKRRQEQRSATIPSLGIPETPGQAEREPEPDDGDYDE